MPDPLVTLRPVPFVPEIRLELADDTTSLWDSSDGEYHTDEPPPFWAFAWAGGIGMSRFLLDNPSVVRGQRVLDIGSGSGIVAIAAARAGAVHVRAVDTDAEAVAAIDRNARANHVEVFGVAEDPLLATPGDVDVLLVGDMFYSATIANRLMRFLRRAQRANPGVRVLVGDPNRGYLTPDRFDQRAAYDVPVRPALEDAETMRATIWELRPAPPAP